ncbi:MAG: Gfo/Idh/MocA family protein [Nocardioidaceae bacterium]
MEPLRIGVLGAARITERALVDPARVTGHRLVAVAARDRARAEAFAAEHGVERVHDSYADLLSDPDVEAVYNPLANGLHAPWNLAAIAAGKHVLTEKPSASNAVEAAQVRDAAASAGVVTMEAFHYLFHPVTQRLHQILASGELGQLVHVDAYLAMAEPGSDDPRWSLELAGGATMDLGCYALHAHRVLAPWAGGPPRVLAARAGVREGHPGVDEWLDADLQFPAGVTGSAGCSMAGHRFEVTYRLTGAAGTATVGNFVKPHLDDTVHVSTGEGERTEQLGKRSSYTYQLEAFADRIRNQTPLPIDVDDAVATMDLVDECYRAAGLTPRPSIDEGTPP